MMGKLSFDADPYGGDDVLYVTGVGMWTDEEAREHFLHFAMLVEARRAAGRPVRVLVDLRDASVQTGAIAERMGEGAAHIHRPEDRIAFLCATVLHSLQVKRTVRVGQVECFQSVEAAEVWRRIDESGVAAASL